MFPRHVCVIALVILSGFCRDENPKVLLDAKSSNSRIVYFAKRNPVIPQSFTIACQVNHQINSLRSVSLCCRLDRKSKERSCARLSDSQPQGEVSCMKTTFAYKLDVLNGANFTIKVDSSKKPEHPIAGLFSCSILDAGDTTISSNDIEIRDIVYYMQKLPTKPGNDVAHVGPIALSSFPYALSCTQQSYSKDWPEWMHYIGSSFDVYQWGFCEVTEPINAVTCLKRGSKLLNENGITFSNGSIYLIDSSFLQKGDKAIVCKGEEEYAPIIAFAGKVTPGEIPLIFEGIKLDSSPQESDHLIALSQTIQTFHFVSGSKLNGFALNALYREPAGSSSYQWWKDNQLVPGRGANKFSYQLPLDADASVVGVYKLIVTSTINPEDQLTFTFIVHVVSSPTFNDPNCLEGLFYVMRNFNYSTFCPFTSKTPPKVYVGVNQYETTNAEQLRELLKQEASLNRKLSELDVNFQTQEVDSDVRWVSVNISSMQLGQDFQLLIRLENSYGETHVYSSLRVVPPPKFYIAPQSYNCAEQCDSQPYNLSCVLDPELVQRWERNYEMIPTVSWVIQNQWFSETIGPKDLGRFFTTDKDVLTVWPQGRPDLQPSPTVNQDSSDTINTNSEPQPARQLSLKEYLAESTGSNGQRAPESLHLRCRVRLYVITKEPHFSPLPVSSDLLRRVRQQRWQRSGTLISQTVDPRLFYDSSIDPDPELLSQMIAVRSFTPDEQPSESF